MAKKKIKKKSIPRVIRSEIKKKVPAKQAVAIAYSSAGLSRKKKGKKK